MQVIDPEFPPRGDIRIRARLVPVAPFQHGRRMNSLAASIAQARDDDSEDEDAHRNYVVLLRRGGRWQRRNGIDQCPVGGRALYAQYCATPPSKRGKERVESGQVPAPAFHSSGCIAFIERSELRSAEYSAQDFAAFWVAAGSKPEGAFNELVSS